MPICLSLVGEGSVIVTVVGEQADWNVGVKDTVAVANAVLTQEQIRLVQDGETIQIRIEVSDIANKVPQKDMEVVEQGLAQYQDQIPGLTLGMYTDISLFIKIGEDDWNAVTQTHSPIEVVVQVPQELLAQGRTSYIIRAHEGEHALLEDMDADDSTIAVRTELFSTYAIAYPQEVQQAQSTCALCHICPTFLGICCFVWLAIALVIIAAVIVLYSKKRKKDKENLPS